MARHIHLQNMRSPEYAKCGPWAGAGEYPLTTDHSKVTCLRCGARMAGCNCDGCWAEGSAMRRAAEAARDRKDRRKAQRRPRAAARATTPGAGACTDCGRLSLHLLTYVTGAPLCPACGLAEVRAPGAGELLVAGSER